MRDERSWVEATAWERRDQRVVERTKEEAKDESEDMNGGAAANGGADEMADDIALLFFYRILRNLQC